MAPSEHLAAGRSNDTDACVQVTVCRPSELGPTELRRWAALQAVDAAAQHPFLSPAFVRAAGVARPDARVAVVEDGPVVVAFWPFSVDGRRAATAVAPGFTDGEGMVRQPGLVLPWVDLLRRCGLAGWRFSHLVGDQHQAVGGHVAVSHSPVIELADGLGAYRAWGMAHHHRRFSNTARKARAMVARHGGQLQVGADHAVADRLMAMKSAQCRARGWRDMFAAAWPRVLVHAVLDQDVEGFTAVTVVQWAMGAPAAMFMDLRLGPVECGWFSVYDDQFRALAPGIVGTFGIVEAAAAAGVTRIDMGKGSEPHKQWMANDRAVVASGMLGSGGAAGTLFTARHLGSLAVQRWLADHPRRDQQAQGAVQALRRVGARVGSGPTRVRSHNR